MILRAMWCAMTENAFAVINEYRKKAPVDVEGLIRALGLGVQKALLDRNITGMIEKSKDDGYVITVNERDPLTRQRFTMAHELGHYIYHRARIGDGVDDDRLYRSTGKYKTSRIGMAQETQANQFAANLLMPWDLIARLQSEGFKIPEELARHLCVSLHAMCIQLGVPYSDNSAISSSDHT